MSKILFSIVIPTYNRADFIVKTIQSILNQTYSNFEIIVVDDGSTDNTEEIVKAIKDSRINYYKKENAERGAARNFGTQKAKGDYINFFDSDDLAYDNHLTTASEVIKENDFPAVFALHYDIKNINNQTLRIGTPFKNINHQLINGNLLSCNGVFLKRDTALEHPFSEIRELSASEDYLLWLELAANYVFKHSNTKTSAILEHDARSVLNINKEVLIKRKQLMLQMALEDEAINNYYANSLNSLKINTYSYISLHLVMAGYKKDGFKYLLKSLKSSPGFILKKRFFAIIKHLIF